MDKQIVILGSTGSIGRQTLEIVREQKDIHIAALAAKSNIDLLEKQILEFQPKLVCVWDEHAAKKLSDRISVKTEIVTGMEGLVACATLPEATMIVNAVVGMIGIRPTIAAIEAGKNIAFANKETLVTAGHLIMPLVKKYQIQFLPVDSEHSAIFQSIQGQDKASIEKLLLTASGGPFRGKKRNDLMNVTAEAALCHPNWTMGRKITIDSATMVNKGLELMEAKWLFGLSSKQIEVLIHPQSIIHSMVMYQDGAVIAQLGLPDMKVPIQYALTYPERKPMSGKKIDFTDISALTFEKPDTDTFQAIVMAYDICDSSGSYPTVYNAANEFAVAKFLAGEIGFLKITEFIERAMQKHQNITNPTLQEILETEQETYRYLETIYQKGE